MRSLVVVAHPSGDSFCHALLERAIAGLCAAGHDVEVLDLYALDVGGAMTSAERDAYESDAPLLDPMIAAHADLVRRAQVLVFVYPTWWSGLPAILKGWLERVMVPGVGFVFDERGRVRPGLGQVRRIVGISTYGSPRRYVRLVNDNGRRTICRTLRMSCGWRARTTWLGLYGIDTTSMSDRVRFAADVERTLAGL